MPIVAQRRNLHAHRAQALAGRRADREVNVNLKFDWTINFPLLITIGLGVIGVFRVWLTQRDFNRDILIILGKKAPREERSGLLGDVAHLQDQSDLHETMLDQHHHALQLDRRFNQRRKSPS